MPPNPLPAGRGRAGIKPPTFDVIDSPAGTSLVMDGISRDTTKTVPFVGSAAVPKNSAPPFTLGNWMVSIRLGGEPRRSTVALLRLCGQEPAAHPAPRT